MTLRYHLRMGDLFVVTTDHCFARWTFEVLEATSWTRLSDVEGWYRYLLGTNPLMKDGLCITSYLPEIMTAPVAPVTSGGTNEPQTTRTQVDSGGLPLVQAPEATGIEALGSPTVLEPASV